MDKHATHRGELCESRLPGVNMTHFVRKICTDKDRINTAFSYAGKLNTAEKSAGFARPPRRVHTVKIT